jgi:DNA recombination protein RmuC
MTLDLAVAFLIGLLFGLIVWLWQRARAQAERAGLLARAEQVEGALDEMRKVLAEREAQLARQQAESAELKARVVELDTLLGQERAAAAEKLKLLEEARAQLAESFKALSAEALARNNQSFLDLAKQSLAAQQEAAKGELETRRQAVEALVKPLHETLTRLDRQAQEMEKARTAAYATLTEQVKGLLGAQQDLKTETARLVTALRRPEVRGRWGEIQLRRVVEMAGMQAHCDFYEQETGDADGRRQRPDMLVRLPAGKCVVLDAKAPVAAYLDAVEAHDETHRRQHLERFARHVREHIQALAAKANWEQFQPAPEFVVLFLPGESFFSAALEQDPTLIEYASEHKVVLATPTTLIALLKAVYYGWREAAMAENARAISELGRALYERLGKLAEHWAQVGRSLAQATEAYNRATGTLETRVLVTARRFESLHATPAGRAIPTPPPVEQQPRRLQSPEMGEAAGNGIGAGIDHPDP